MDEQPFSKGIALDYLWIHSHYYSQRLFECEELYRNGRGYAAITLLFACLENISKSIANDYESSAYDIYKKLYTSRLISKKEYNFINEEKYCLRKIRNLFAHANLGAINYIVEENGNDFLYPLAEEDTCLLIYQNISTIVFKLILKIVSSTFFEEVKERLTICADSDIDHCFLRFRVLSVKELLVMKGFPEDYIPDDLGIPEDAQISLIENALDLNLAKHIFENIAKIEKES